jgi:glycosyltransferase involved in cell wall biosynthesis
VTVLHIIGSVDPASGGPIESVLQHALMLRDGDPEFHVVSLDSPDAPFLKNFPLKIFPRGIKRPPRWWKCTPWGRYGYQPGLAPWLRAHIQEYDAVIVHGLWNYSVMAARTTLASANVPYAVFTHGMLDPWFRKTYPIKTLAKQLFWLFCEGPLMNNADAIFFTTEDERVTSQNAFYPYRVREQVVGLGMSDVAGDTQAQIAAFRNAVPALGDRRYLLYLSRIHPKKGVDMLIEGFAGIARDHPDIDLVIAGPDQVGWKSELERIAQHHGIADRIHWPGMLTEDPKWGAFHGCEAFVLPSHQENFGIVVIEALACAKPVLITNKVQIWREVANGQAGLVGDDTAAGTQALLGDFLALDQGTVAAMNRQARALFESRFEISKVVDGINNAITSIIRPRPARRT